MYGRAHNVFASENLIEKSRKKNLVLFNSTKIVAKFLIQILATKENQNDNEINNNLCVYVCHESIESTVKFSSENNVLKSVCECEEKKK